MKNIFFLYALSSLLILKSSQEIIFQLPTAAKLENLLIKHGYSHIIQKTTIQSLLHFKINSKVLVDTKEFVTLFTERCYEFVGERESIFYPFNMIQTQPIRKYSLGYIIKDMLPYLKQKDDYLFFDIPEENIKQIFQKTRINIIEELG